jgi:hypothetical protein
MSNYLLITVVKQIIKSIKRLQTNPRSRQSLPFE